MKKCRVRIVKGIKQGICALLCACFTLPLFGCEKKPPVVQTGVVVTPTLSQPYSLQTEEYAQRVIYRVLKRFFQKTVMENLPDATIEKLRTQAENIQKITANAPISEGNYLSCMQVLESNAESYTDALARVEKGETLEGDIQIFKQAYAELASKMGAETLGAVTYRLCLYRYDYEYETSMQRYEKYGYTYLKVEAEAFAKEKAILQEEVGERNFTSVMQTLCLFSDLFVGGAFEQGQLASFSDQEILALLQAPNLSSIQMNESGWELLLSYLNAFFASTSYEGKLFAKAVENGDCKVLAAQMDNVFKFLSAVQENLTVEQAAWIRQKERELVVSSIFGGLSESEWALFEQITSMQLKKEEYQTIAEKVYGEAFEVYVSSLTNVSLDEVKAVAGTENFFQILKNYLAGICPAISYRFTL